MDSVPKLLRTSIRRLSFLFPETLRRKLLFDVLAPYREKELPLLGRSAFQTGQYCELQFWKFLKEPNHEFDISNQFISPKQKALLKDIAGSLFPDAKHAGYKDSKTRSYLDSKQPVKGACVRTKFFDTRADFLIPNEEGWQVIIIKASSSAKRTHISELSFIRMVLEEAGYKVSSTQVWTISSEYSYTGAEIDPNRLFHKKDCSKETLANIEGIKEKAYQLLEVLEKDKIPSITSSKHCDHPRNCIHPESCYSDSPPGDLFTLREGKDLTLTLWNQGIRNLSEVEPDSEFTHRQKIQVEAIKTGKEYLDTDSLLAFLNKLKFPLYCLDFETINPPVPVYKDTHPFQHVPFLYSLHVIRKDLKEKPEEYTYIDDHEKDPRLGILESLSSQIKPGGTILAFNDSFEKRCLKESVQAYPKYKEWFQSIEPDFLDLAKPFWDYDYYHPAQEGTTSLKVVLPVLTGANYKELTINAGHIANSEFLRIKTENVSDQERRSVESDLIAYCKMDTYALILILRALAEKLNWPGKL
ncbi:DUF2779 domain-containing protein [Leptospira koniambonensis]|uniref:DUF2779 domain-containing protein n=1 Tax=Leptospira koniambonensis TaxID=2484950 RepID=A0A4R9J7Z0_9LEPT|nr:DUF2779 domain-containing protein [Leptospira koniambonensis]TGL34535.1 DUF2779 domain-containing protein [Leptospira koniambonensis]